MTYPQHTAAHYDTDMFVALGHNTVYSTIKSHRNTHAPAQNGSSPVCTHTYVSDLYHMYIFSIRIICISSRVCTQTYLSDLSHTYMFLICIIYICFRFVSHVYLSDLYYMYMFAICIVCIYHHQYAQSLMFPICIICISFRFVLYVCIITSMHTRF